jgi:uncharacterized protein (TIGR03083 family)
MSRGTDPMNDATVDELLAAYALNACEPEEAEQIEQYLAAHPGVAAELAQLSTAAAWIGATEALTPPPGLRADVLAEARVRRNRGARDESLDLLREQTNELDDLVSRLVPADLGVATVNGLSIRDLVIHLAAMETMVSAALRGTDQPVVSTVDVDERTAAFVEVFAVRPLDEVRSLWRRSVDEIIEWAESGATEGLVPWLGIALDRDTVLIIRAFETWIHANDIRRALGLPLVSPRPSQLHRMADFSMRSLPVWLEVSGRAHPGRAAQIVLTGVGGGSWLVPLELSEASVVESVDPGAVDVVIEADIIDWCHRVAERITTDAISVQVTGSADLAVDILDSASALAML